MTAKFKIQAVCKQGIKLQSQQPPLGQHTAPLLDHIPEIRLQCVIPDHHRFSKQGSHLRAANVKYITKPGNVLQCHIAALGHQAVAQSCSIQKQVQPVLVANLAQIPELL